VTDPTAEGSGVSRRALVTTGGLVAAALGGLGAAASVAATSGPNSGPKAGLNSGSNSDSAADDGFGLETVPFYGSHQAGIDAPAGQAHGRFIALDLVPGSKPDDVRRLLRLLTDDAARMMSGRPPLAAEDPELPARPSRLTVTVGFGAGLFDAIDRRADCPAVVRQLPAFSTDRLEKRWSGGDLLLQVCSDDPIPLSYAVRRLVRDARGIATVRWVQTGFNPARGSERAGTTARNLFGQRDGTANPTAASGELARAVWVQQGPDWLVGGSMLVLRRISMDLDTWDDLGRPAKEQGFARRLSDGAPVTGGAEHDKPDLTAVDAQGFPVVADEAHVARATPRVPAEQMLRRGFSYDDGPGPDGESNAGLIFAAYQADISTAFVPVQQRLAEQDALNLWATHIGSAAFVVPPGCADGEFLGHRLFE
jgi:dye decolorizing peroxidase